MAIQQPKGAFCILQECGGARGHSGAPIVLLHPSTGSGLGLSEVEGLRKAKQWERSACGR